jgi:hypothetical protein
MSNLIRAIIPRLQSYALNDEFSEKRKLTDVMEGQYGQPTEPTAMRQLQDKSQGKSPTPFTAKVQLDR